MVEPETQHILLISSCPDCSMAVAAAVGKNGASLGAESDYTVHTLAPEDLVQAGSDHFATGNPDLTLIDWAESNCDGVLEWLASETVRSALRNVVVLAEEVITAATVIESDLPNVPILILPRLLDPRFLRREIHFAVGVDRRPNGPSNQQEGTRGLTLRAAEVERRAEELERWKKEFLANVSHELRTPMNAILGYSRLLLNEQLPERYHRQVEEIHGAGTGLLELINNIIDFTKLSGGEIRLARIPFHIRDVAAELVEHCRPATEHKDLRLECHVPSNVPTFLRGDKHRYRQILASLLSNAVKFTERGGISVQLTVDDVSGDQVTLRTVVTDTGVGIPSDRAEAVFQEFSQGDGSTTRSFGGLGLGLAVAKRLVDLMGGQIGYRSVVGDGTSFWVELPFGLVEKADNLPPENPADQYLAANGPAAVGSGRPRILAVDGDATQRILIEAFLSRMGCLVDAVSSTDDAVAAAKGLHYNLAFVEVNEGSAGRWEAVRRIRDAFKKQGQHTPIIALGTEQISPQRQTIIQAGANGLLLKPFAVPQLIETVGKYLQLDTRQLEETSTTLELAGRSSEEDTGTSWFDQMDEVKRAFAAADYACLEARTGALRRRALKQGSRAAADGAMRLQVAVRSGDSHRINSALERLERIVCATRDAETTRRTQFQTC